MTNIDPNCVVACLQTAEVAVKEIATPALTNGLMTLAGSLGGGSIIGFASGYFIKKIVKVIMIFVGLISFALMYLGYKGWFTVNWDEAEGTVRESSEKAIEEITKVVQNTASDFNDGTGIMGSDVAVGGVIFGFVPSFLYGMKKG